MITRVLLPAFLLPVTLATPPGLGMSTSKYIRSHDNNIYASTVLVTAVVRSTSHCATMCSRTDRCQAINVCPRDGFPRQADCSLLSEAFSQSENSVQNDPPVQNCVHMTRVEPEVVIQDTSAAAEGTTEPMRCENGGSLENGICWCPVQYSGTTCERLIRDCTEPYENGYIAGFPGTPLLIQPVGAAAPFWVVCLLTSPAMTYPLIRSSMISFNVNWTAAKSRLGVSNSAVSYTSDYFIGLDNLHHLLTQADYVGSVYCRYNNLQSEGWVYYNGFSVGPENSSYSLSYQSSFTYGPLTLDNGFTGGASLAFHTRDHDTNNCKKGYPGWFGPDCTAYSLFSDTVVWPINGVTKIVDYLNLAVGRVSAFTEN